MNLDETIDVLLEHKAPPLAQVALISGVDKTPGSDRLHSYSVNCGGWTLISSNINQKYDEAGNCIDVGTPRYSLNDKIIYIAVDSVIPEKLEKICFPEGSKTSLKGGRVGVLKLRGAYSEGLPVQIDQELLEAFPALKEMPLENGTDVTEALGVVKYEPPVVRMPKELRAGMASKKNPFFKEYTDIRHLKYYKVFNEGDPVEVTAKIHGCLQGKTKILLADGTSRTIKDIVDSKDPVEVLSLNENHEIVACKVTDWFNWGPTDSWYEIKYKRSGFAHGNSFGLIRCTPNHKFWSPIKHKWIEAQDLILDDKVVIIREARNLPPIQEQILTGKMLGDGHLNILTGAVTFGHKVEHEEYVDYTLDLLGELAVRTKDYKVSGYGTSMVRAKSRANSIVKEKFSSWFTSGSKQVPEGLRLTPLSLAFWYMDDGSLTHDDNQRDRASLATCGFNEKSVDNLLQALLMLGIKANKHLTGGEYWRISVYCEEAEHFFNLICPYVPRCMQYKLPETLRGVQPVVFDSKLKDIKLLETQDLLAIEVKPSVSKHGRRMYDLETENHNYFANGVLTHNTSVRFANVPIVVPPLRFKDVFRTPCSFFRTLVKHVKRKFGKLPSHEYCFGCFDYHTKIDLLNGTRLPIGKIVANKLGVELAGYKDGKIVPTKILNHFNNGTTEDWLEIFTTRKSSGIGAPSRRIMCTPNHRIFCKNAGGFVPASSLSVGDVVLSKQKVLVLDYVQEQILIGKMLGDGSLSDNHISFGHSESQEEYLNYTLKCLGNIAGGRQKDAISGHGSVIKRAKSIARPAIRELFHSWVESGAKEVPETGIDLGPIALAFWYMDDGSLLKVNEDQHPCAMFNTQGFSYQSQVALSKALNRLGLECRIINAPNNRYRILLNSVDTYKLGVLIAPYVCSSMRYKLPSQFVDYPEVLLRGAGSFIEDLVPQEILKINPVKKLKSNVKYDLETETGNYFANGVLVHNSRRVQLQDKEPGHKGFYEENVYHRVSEQYKIKSVLEPNTQLFGEIVGHGIQKNYTYGTKPGELAFYAYDVMVGNTYLSPSKFRAWCDARKIPRVPDLGVHPFNVEKLTELASAKTCLNGQKVREGVVIKPLEEKSHPLCGRMVFKLINPEYMLKDNSDWH